MLLYKTDSYKTSHYLQFPDDLEYSHYYLEARGKGLQLRYFGLQAILKEYFSEVPTLEEVAEASNFYAKHGVPFNKEGWDYISRLGYYPLHIVSKPEGSLANRGEPLLTIQNTGGNCSWLPGWAETTLMQVWYPTTVCTRSYHIKCIILDALERSGSPELIDFKLHDFGYRGVSSQESAAIGGCAHLVNFLGTDTVPALLHAKKYYGADMAGFSIPASEHSTITSYGEEDEYAAYENMVDQFGSGLYACVSDSYDLTNAVTNLWGGKLKDKVIKAGGTLVIRPDSGNPTEIVIRTLQECEEVFGAVKNDKGYKVLPDYVRIIQGDGISSPSEIKYILHNLMSYGFSADNIAFGMGGGLLQDLNRDTCKFAMKMSAGWFGNHLRDIQKNPKDAPWKKSRGGMQVVEDGEVVFHDGKLMVDVTLDQVRERA